MKRIFTITLVVFISIFFLTSGFALTTDEIVKLKKAGVSDKTIQIMLQQEKEGVREVKEEEGNIHIIYSTGSSSQKNKMDIEEEEKVRRAWKMLESMIIDNRH
jgi:hypothetical protein